MRTLHEARAPLGALLEDLRALLAAASMPTRFDGDVLVAGDEDRTVRVEAVEPAVRETVDGTLRAVVRVLADLPPAARGLLGVHPAFDAGTCNTYAALGALHADAGGTARVGSRLTIHDSEADAWRPLQLPLLMAAAVTGAEPILGGLRRSMSAEAPVGASAWTAQDFEQARHWLSRVGFCNADARSLCVEFGLAEGAVSAITGDRRTALLRLSADQPHPELGGGLLCMLAMPRLAPDDARLRTICAQLNALEMAADDLPPHFGAWCPSRMGLRPAYVSFLPNALHPVGGIAANFAMWAMHRARWADAMLAAMGAKSA